MAKTAPVKPEGLNPDREMFVMCMTRPGTDTFNNATLSYAAVYKPNLYMLSKDPVYNKKKKKIKDSAYDRALAVCRTQGSVLFAKPNIRNAIEQRWLKLFGDYEKRDMRLAQLAFQGDDGHLALAAIRDANKLSKRVGTDDPVAPIGAQPITKIEIVMPAGATLKKTLR